MRNFGDRLWIGAVLAAGALGAAPTVTVTSVTQDAVRHRVTVNYELSEDAIVTASLASGGRTLAAPRVWGDVQAAVPGGARSFSWTPADADDCVGHAVTFTVSAWDPADPPDYLVCDLDLGTRAHYATTNDLPEGVGSDLYRTSKLLLRRIPAAHRLWDMGEDGEAVAPRHPVALQDDFWIGVFEVTQEQWRHVMGDYKGYFTAERATRPVESASYFEVRANANDRMVHFAPGAPFEGSFMGRLRQVAALDFDLPTEAQWEYACRAGTTTRYCNGTDDVQPEAVLGRAGNGSSPAPGTAPADGGTQRVGSLAPNGFGLYDMYGNVSEWCVDCYHEDNYGQARTAGEAIDPCNWANPMTEAVDANKNNTYIRRGGGWRDAAAYGRSAARWYWNSGVNSVGFRVMCHGPVAAQD